jgi:hypothetical protein
MMMTSIQSFEIALRFDPGRQYRSPAWFNTSIVSALSEPSTLDDDSHEVLLLRGRSFKSSLLECLLGRIVNLLSRASRAIADAVRLDVAWVHLVRLDGVVLCTKQANTMSASL